MAIYPWWWAWSEFDGCCSDLRDKRLKFNIEDDNYELLLDGFCDNNGHDGDVPEIRNILMGGEWGCGKSMDGEQRWNPELNAAFYLCISKQNLALMFTAGVTGPTSPQDLENNQG